MTTQHLNLLDPALKPVRVPYAATQWLAAALVVLAGSAVLAAGLQWQSRGMRDQAARLQPAQLAPAAPAVSAPADLAAAQAELAQLHQLDAAQRRVQAALQGGVAGQREGYVDYFMALARQAQPNLWITGFSVGPDGQALAIEGRMSDAGELPSYLRRLNEEPRFRGRPLAQLQLKSVDAADGPGFTEFALRSQPAAGAKR